MQQTEASQKYPLLKKYLVKRRQMQQQSNRSDLSMFSSHPAPQFTPFHDKDPFKKYQTLTTNLENSVAQPEDNEENPEPTLANTNQPTQQLLPKINFHPKLTYGNHSTLNSQHNRLQTVKLRTRELTHHQSDPLYTRIQKTVARRVKEKFSKYNREWVDSTSKRKSKSILQRSYLKTGQMLQNVRKDAFIRKNTTHLEEMLRNNIAQKTFVFPGVPCRQIQGLKGKGGKAIPLFEQIYMTEEVFKKHSSKQA